MDNDNPTPSSSNSSNLTVEDKLQKIHISSSTDDDDSDTTKSFYSDSEPESLSSINFPVQYKLPSRNHAVVHSSANRTLMNRMAPSNKSVRMKHGTTALDIIVPVIRGTTTPSTSGTSQRNTTTPSTSGTSQCNTTTPSTSGTSQRDTTTPSTNGTSQCNTTTPSTSGTNQRNTTATSKSDTSQRNATGTSKSDTTTQMNNSTPANSTSLASTLYVPALWMFPSASSSRTVSTANKPKAPIPPPRPRSSLPPYTAPPRYVEPSNRFQTSKYTKTSQRPIPPYRYPYPSPRYTTQPSSLSYTYRSPSLTYTSQSFNTSNMSQTAMISIRSQSSAPSCRSNYPTPIKSTPTSVPFYSLQSSSRTIVSQTFSSSLRSQTSKTSNTSQISIHSKKSQSSTPFYKPRYPLPNEITPSSTELHTSQPSLAILSRTSKTPNTSQISMHSKRSQSSTPFYKPRYPLPNESIPSSTELHTSQPSSLTNTSQTSNTINTSQTSNTINTSQTSNTINTFQTSTPSRSLSCSKPSGSSQSSAPINKSQPSSQSQTTQSSTSTITLTSSSVRLTPRYERYRAEMTYSHFTFPRSTHYQKPKLKKYYTVMPQSSTKNLYPLTVCKPRRNVWPTEIGSVVQVSMQNIWSVLVAQLHKSLPSSTTVNLQNPSQPSTIKSVDKKALLPPVAPSTNNQPLLNVDPESSDSKETESKLCVKKSHSYPVVDLLPLYLHGIEKKDALEKHIKNELQVAWGYFSKLEVVDVRSSGDIKCICPMLNYEDLLDATLNEKFMLVNMSRQYRVNNLLFETTYDYDNLPNKTIVAENMENKIYRWLNTQNMKELNWFFKTLNFFEIQNINPTNIQKLITRSKIKKTVSLIFQLDMCCLLKKIKERPVTLLAILLHLKKKDINRYQFAKVIIPFLIEILQFPISNEIDMVDDVMNEYVAMIWRVLLTEIIKFFNVDDTDDTKDWEKQFSVYDTEKAIKLLKSYIPTK